MQGMAGEKVSTVVGDTHGLLRQCSVSQNVGSQVQVALGEERKPHTFTRVRALTMRERHVGMDD